MDPRNETFLKHFGVRFVMVQEATKIAAALRTHPRFRLLEPSGSYFQVCEYLDAEPAWQFAGRTEIVRWTPERREFLVNTSADERFLLREQFWPGWKAYADGRRLPVARCAGTFQCATVPAGTRRIEFLYQPDSLYFGAAISLAGWIALLATASSRKSALARDSKLTTSAKRVSGACRISQPA